MNSFNDDYDDDDTVAIAAPTTERIDGDTYPVKDALRSLGCHWNSMARAWFAPIGAVAEKARALVAAHAAQNPPPPKPAPAAAAPEPPATGEHAGTVGEKLELELTCSSLRDIETEFNRKKVISTLAIFKDGAGRSFKWFTASLPAEIKEGAASTITGTVKSHDFFKAERVTVLTRCKVAGATKLVATHGLTLFCDGKAKADGYAFTDARGEVLEFGTIEPSMPIDFWPGYDGRDGLGQPDSEICSALLAFNFARRVKEAAKLDCLKLEFHFDAEWLKGMVGKARPLRDFAKKHKLLVSMNWVPGTSNPADEWTTAGGSRRVDDADLAGNAVPV